MATGWLSVIGLAVVAALAAAPAADADPPTVHFAGFAMAEGHVQNQQLYPRSQQLIEPSSRVFGPGGIDAALRRKIEATHFDNLRIAGDLGDYKRGDALAVACVLTWENVSTETYPDFTKLAVNLQAEALVFDFNTKQVVSAYPFGVEYIDVVRGEASPDKVLGDVALAYERPGDGLLDAFVEALKRVNPKPSFMGRMQIVSSDIAPPAAVNLAAASVDPATAQALLENAFERYTSVNGDIPVLPHSTEGGQAASEAIGNRMAAQFTNGDIYNFTIPPCDYRVRVTLDNVRKVVVSQTPVESAIAYASYVTVRIDQPLSGAEYLNASVKFPVVKVIARSGTPDDGAEFQESILSIADQTTRQFRSYSKDWAAKWVVREGAPGELAKVSTLLDRCR